MTDEEITTAAKKCYLIEPNDWLLPNSGLILFARVIAKRQKELDAGICNNFGEREMHPYECEGAILAQKD